MRRALTQTDGCLAASRGGTECASCVSGAVCTAMICVAWMTCMTLMSLSFSVGCASSGRVAGEEHKKGAPVGSDSAFPQASAGASLLVETLEKLALPWRDASSGLALVREGHAAEPLRLALLTDAQTEARTEAQIEARAEEPRSRQNADKLTSQDCSWRAEYRLDARAKRRVGADDQLASPFDADAPMVKVEEWGSRLANDGEVSVKRKFLVQGLASGRALTLDIPLESVGGERLQLFVHGAEVKPEFGATHLVIELARDEATSIELRLIAPTPR